MRHYSRVIFFQLTLNMKPYLFAPLLLIALDAQSSVDAPKTTYVQIGAAIGIHEGPYRDYSSEPLVLPLIVYEGSLVYFRGGEAGVKLYKTDSDELTLSASLLPIFFKPGKAEAQNFQKLNERKMSAMAGFAWNHKSDWGSTSLYSRQRVTGNKEGRTMGASYVYPIQMGKMTLLPSAGVDYSSAKLNNIYFGVSKEESSRTGVHYYDAGSGVSPYFDLMANYLLTDNISVSGGGRLTALSDSAYNSPMTENHYMYSFVGTISYRF